jgi:hypothetical protein
VLTDAVGGRRWQSARRMRSTRERRASAENGCSIFCRNVASRMSEKLERVKGIEPSSSAWKAVGKPNKINGD